MQSVGEDCYVAWDCVEEFGGFLSMNKMREKWLNVSLLAPW